MSKSYSIVVGFVVVVELGMPDRTLELGNVVGFVVVVELGMPDTTLELGNVVGFVVVVELGMPDTTLELGNPTENNRTNFFKETIPFSRNDNLNMSLLYSLRLPLWLDQRL